MSEKHLGKDLSNFYLIKRQHWLVGLLAVKEVLRQMVVDSNWFKKKRSKARNMSELHLANGSIEPRRVEGQLRLYSMKFCPYAQRPRLVLLAKGIPHDIVNINLIDKPDWYFKIHPKGLVPALLDGEKIILESLDISDYLDQKYPENPLYPAEPSEKAKDKELIAKISSVVDVFHKVLVQEVTDKTPEEWLKEFLVPLQAFEDELERRKSVFFGGEKPGMVDLMLWPWAERAPAIAIKLGAKLPINDNQIPLLRKWRKALRQNPAVVAVATTPEQFMKVIDNKLKKIPPNHDVI